MTISIVDCSSPSYKEDFVHSIKETGFAVLKNQKFKDQNENEATYANKITEKLKHTKIKLADTRKTTPNFRLFEKQAVLLGGGQIFVGNAESVWCLLH